MSPTFQSLFSLGVENDKNPTMKDPGKLYSKIINQTLSVQAVIMSDLTNISVGVMDNSLL